MYISYISYTTYLLYMCRMSTFHHLCTGQQMLSMSTFHQSCNLRLPALACMDILKSETYILGELRYTYYDIWWLKKELSMVHGKLHFFFWNKTLLFVKIKSWNFQQLFDLGFRETLQNFSSFRHTFRWHLCMGNKELSK